MPVELPTYDWGATGIGKSTIVKDLIKEGGETTMTQEFNKAKLIKKFKDQHKEAAAEYAALSTAAQDFATAETILKETMPGGMQIEHDTWTSNSIQSILDGVARRERVLKAKIEALEVLDGETVSMTLRDVEELLDHA